MMPRMPPTARNSAPALGASPARPARSRSVRAAAANASRKDGSVWGVSSE